MEKGTTPNLIRLTFIICVFFGLLHAFINHPIEDAVAGFIIGVTGIICFCAYFTPGGIPPTAGMMLAVAWILGVLIFGAIFAQDFMSAALDRVQYYSELHVFGLLNPDSLPDNWWTTDTVSFFVGTTIALICMLILCAIGAVKS